MENGWTQVTSKRNRSQSKTESDKSLTSPARTNRQTNVWRKQHRRKVDLYRPDGTTLIMAGINMKKFRRFSVFAQAFTPTDSSTYDPDEPALTIIMPKSGGKREPTNEAVEWLLNWLIEHAEDDKAPVLHTKNMKTNLRHSINVYITGEILQLTVKMEPLRAEIHTVMMNKPIFHHELENIVNVLPLEHGLVKAAVQSLTYYYVGDRISEANNEALEDVIYQDQEVAAMFDAELKRQKQLQVAGIKKVHSGSSTGMRGVLIRRHVGTQTDAVRDDEQVSPKLSNGVDMEKASVRTAATKRQARQRAEEIRGRASVISVGREDISDEAIAAKVEVKQRAEEAAAVARKLEGLKYRRYRLLQFGVSLQDANMVYGSTMREMLSKC